MIDVSITPEEYTRAVGRAVVRFKDSRDAGYHDRAVHPDRDWNTLFAQELLGVCGELAVAKAYGHLDDWGSVRTFHEVPDVGGLEVRATPYLNGHLVIRPHELDDLADRRVVLVLVRAPRFRLAGWIWGREAPELGWWGKLGGRGDDAWNVPQDRLRQLVERVPA